jgi:hypothetical protein
MKNINEEAVYKLNFSCGKQGDLTGVFIAKKNHIKILLENKIEVYFGEVLGKHSRIYGKIEEKNIELVSDSSEVIDVIKTHKLENGFNPFEYRAINTGREVFEDLTVFEVVEILENEYFSKTNINGNTGLPTEEQVLNTIFDCVFIRGIELEDYRRNFSNQECKLYDRLVSLFNKNNK